MAGSNLFLILLLLSFAFSAAGCSEATVREMRRKFTRPGKPKPRQVHFFEDRYTPEYPNATLYNNHYIYWRVFSGDLIEALSSDNYKKQVSSATSTLSELRLMRKYLTGSAAETLDGQLREFEGITQQITESAPSANICARLRVQVEHQRRVISREFYVKKVRDAIQPDVIDAPEAASTEAKQGG